VYLGAVLKPTFSIFIARGMAVLRSIITEFTPYFITMPSFYLAHMWYFLVLGTIHSMQMISFNPPYVSVK